MFDPQVDLGGGGFKPRKGYAKTKKIAVGEYSGCINGSVKNSPHF